MWHTATALSLWPGRTQVTTFGGTPRWERGKSDAARQKLAKTAVAEFGELCTYMVLIFLLVLYSCCRPHRMDYRSGGGMQ